MLGHELESGDREREVGSILPKNWSISVECTGCTWDGDFFFIQRDWIWSRSALGKKCSLKHINFTAMTAFCFSSGSGAGNLDERLLLLLFYLTKMNTPFEHFSSNQFSTSNSK